MTWIAEALQQEKGKYEEKVASIDGIVTTGERFWDNLNLYYLLAGWNFEFRFLLDLFLNIYGHISFEFMDWYNFDMSTLFPQEYCAKYDVTKYGEGVYDPPDLTGTDIENMAWDITYHTTEHDSMEVKLRDKTLKNLLDQLEAIMGPKGIPDYFWEVIIKCVAAAEGKLQRIGYWDVAVWQGNIWTDGENVPVRDVDDWITQLVEETIWVFETWWDWGQWDYARWMDEDIIQRVRIDPEWIHRMGLYLDGKIKDFHASMDPIYSTVRRLQRRDKLVYEGGAWIVQKGFVREKVKRLLQTKDLTSIQYPHYYSFAIELMQLGAESARPYKTWKRLLTSDDLIEKYANQGLNREILQEIRSTIPT